MGILNVKKIYIYQMFVIIAECHALKSRPFTIAPRLLHVVVIGLCLWHEALAIIYNKVYVVLAVYKMVSRRAVSVGTWRDDFPL